MEDQRGLTRRRLARRLGGGAAALLVAPRALAMLATPSQVEGPFYPIEDQLDKDLDLVRIEGHEQQATGEVILVSGRVMGMDGSPLANAVVDVWQANHHGRYSHPEDPNPAPLDPHFQGWGLLRTDAQGDYTLKTILPGPYSLKFLGEDGWRCRHIHFKVSHPGNQPLTTQMYFEGDPLIEQDLEIAKAPADRRDLLISSPTKDLATGLPLYRFDIVLGSL